MHPKILSPRKSAFTLVELLVALRDHWYGSLEQEFCYPYNNSANVLMFDGHVESLTRRRVADPAVTSRLKGLPN